MQQWVCMILSGQRQRTFRMGRPKRQHQPSSYHHNRWYQRQSRTKDNVKKEEEAEEDVPALIWKKTRRGDRTEAKQNVAGKRRKKERAKKADYEPRRQPIEEAAGEREGNKASVDTELPVTPSMEIPEAMTGSPIDIEEIREPLKRRRKDIDCDAPTIPLPQKV